MDSSTLIFVVAIVAVILFYIQKNKRIAELKRDYDDAIRSGNRGMALQAGRKYYSAIRQNGKLTIYDEQAITNDLSTMPTEIK